MKTSIVAVAGLALLLAGGHGAAQTPDRIPTDGRRPERLGTREGRAAGLLERLALDGDRLRQFLSGMADAARAFEAWELAGERVQTVLADSLGASPAAMDSELKRRQGEREKAARAYEGSVDALVTFVAAHLDAERTGALHAYLNAELWYEGLVRADTVTALGEDSAVSAGEEFDPSPYLQGRTVDEWAGEVQKMLEAEVDGERWRSTLFPLTSAPTHPDRARPDVAGSFVGRPSGPPPWLGWEPRSLSPECLRQLLGEGPEPFMRFVWFELLPVLRSQAATASAPR